MATRLLNDSGRKSFFFSRGFIFWRVVLLYDITIIRHKNFCPAYESWFKTNFVFDYIDEQDTKCRAINN